MKNKMENFIRKHSKLFNEYKNFQELGNLIYQTIPELDKSIRIVKRNIYNIENNVPSIFPRYFSIDFYKEKLKELESKKIKLYYDIILKIKDMINPKDYNQFLNDIVDSFALYNEESFIVRMKDQTEQTVREAIDEFVNEMQNSQDIETLKASLISETEKLDKETIEKLKEIGVDIVEEDDINNKSYVLENAFEQHI